VAAAWKCSVRARLRGLVRTESRQQSGGNVHCGMQISRIDSDTRDIFALVTSFRNIFTYIFIVSQKRLALRISGSVRENRRSVLSLRLNRPLNRPSILKIRVSAAALVASSLRCFGNHRRTCDALGTPIRVRVSPRRALLVSLQDFTLLSESTSSPKFS